MISPEQVVIKLLMTSMCGKTIIKPVETDTIIKDSRDDFGKHNSLNYHCIDSTLEVNGRYYIKKGNSVMSHFDYVHCGVGILPMSKRIMNKAFDCANHCGVKICYQDTDLIQLNYDDVDRIGKRYKQKYDQDLVGDGLGNFHVDSSMGGAVIEIHGVESLLSGKKENIYRYFRTNR